MSTSDTVEEFWNWDLVLQAQHAADSSSLNAFREEFGRFIGLNAERIHLMPSGHQGLEWLLKAKHDPRRGVMVPAFNCSVVQNAVATAGHQIQLYDFSPQPGLFDWQRIIEEMGPSVGALVITHYFGVPSDFRPIRDYCTARGIVVIEDCAHTLGGSIDGHQAGTLGDAAIFSFNYDKPISLGWGGIAVINNDTAFDHRVSYGHRVPEIVVEMDLLRQFVTAMKKRRQMIPYNNRLAVRILRLVGLFRGHQFRKDSAISIGAVQAELGRWCLKHYPEVLTTRKTNAQIFAARVNLSTWPVATGVDAAWLKQKVFIEDAQIRQRVSSHLQRIGLRAGNFNWPKLLSGRGQDKCSQAMNAATCWVDVPIHQNLSDNAITVLVDSFNEISQD